MALVQAISPLILTVLPTVLTTVFVISGISGTVVLQLTYPLMAWIPVLNPIYAICCVRAYRMVLVRKLKRNDTKTNVYVSRT